MCFFWVFSEVNEQISEFQTYTEKKYIVFESSLKILFKKCPECRASTEISSCTIGTFLRITQKCLKCEMTSVWESQLFIKYIPAGNLLMSTSIFYAGALPTKSLQVFQHMNCAVISLTTFFRHQQQYLYPAVASVWKKQQLDLLGKLLREEAFNAWRRWQSCQPRTQC